MNERSIFLGALELTDPDQRSRYLDRACGDDPQLRRQVEELLVSHQDSSSFLEKPPEGLVATILGGLHDTLDESLGVDSLDFLEPSDKPGCLGTLAQYEVVDVVGRGGMGLVLRAYDTKLNRVVAIKVMAPELAAIPMAVKRFLREARAAAAISHDHVITIHAIEEDNRPPYIVMEYVDGPSLQEKIDRTGGLKLPEILRIGIQIARGLSAAHEQGLVHRDIKPANILLENGVERVKLTDFGLARAVDDVSVTQTGQIAGTPQFMSPEQASGRPIDARSDLFSLGSVLYTMCAGRPPFRAETSLAVLRRVTDDKPRAIREVNADIPDWLEAIISKLLEKEPSERFQSAEVVAELLSQHLAHLQHPTSSPKPPPVEPQKTEHPLFDLDEQLGFIETTLRIYAWIAIMWAVPALAFAVLVNLVPGNFTASFFHLNAPWALVTGVLSLISSSLAFTGLSHVRRRDSYRLAMAGSVAALLPTNPFLVMAIPWSICSIIKLRNPKLRTAFTPATMPSSSGPRIEVGLAVGGCLLLFLIGSIIIYVSTDYGTIRVEVNDPNTTITIDEEQGLSFENSSNEGTLSVRAGEHKLHIQQGDLEFETDTFRVKRGERILLSVELIEGKLGAKLIRPETHHAEGAGTATVHPGRIIGLHPGPARDQPSERGVLKDYSEPFVLWKEGARRERAFTTLAAAVAAARNGDTIEVNGDGPYVTDPIVIRRRALNIRAAAGFRPVIELSPEVQDATPMIDTHSPLLIEGLKLVRTPVVETDDEERGYYVINSYQAPLLVANCEFGNRFVSIRAYHSPECRIENCVFVQPQDALTFTPGRGSRLLMKNNVMFGIGLLHLHYTDAELVKDVTVELTHNTIIGRPLWLFLHERPKDTTSHAPPIRFHFNDNVVDSVRAMVHLAGSGKLRAESEPPSAEEMRAALRNMVAWNEGRNLLLLYNGYLETAANSRPKSGRWLFIKSDADWQQLWNISQADTLFGRANFACGDIRKLSKARRLSLTPNDLRIISGPGVGASADSHNLGIAVNYVGPGEAYELWKESRDYWQFKRLAPPYDIFDVIDPDSGRQVTHEPGISEQVQSKGSLPEDEREQCK